MWNKKNIIYLSVLAFAGLGIMLSPMAHAAENLITNNSVEIASGNPGIPQSWLKGGYGSNSRVLTYPVPGNHGTRGIRVDITSYTNGDAKWYFNYIPVTPGDIYFFSDEYIANASSHLTVQFKQSDGTFKYIDLGSLAATSGWQTVEKTFTVPANTVALTIFHALRGVGHLVTDNYILNKVTPPPVDPNNKVLNPSLETPSSSNPSLPQSWQKGGYGNNNRVLTYPVSGHTGSSAARVDITNYADGDAKWYFNNVSVIPGDSYEFSDYYLSNATSFVTVQFKHTNGSFSYKFLDDLPPAATWTEYKRTFLVPSGISSLTVFHALRGVGRLTVDTYYLKKFFTNKFNEGMVTLTFDDGYASVYQNAVPMLTDRGIKSTHYIVNNYLNNFSSYMNTNQVLEVNYLENEIGGHTHGHAHLTQLSDADAWDQIYQAKQDLLNLGMTPVNTFAYPFGEYDSRVKQMVKDAGFIGARTVDQGYNYRDTDKYVLKVQHGDHNTPLATMKSWIDQAKADRSWLIVKIHQVKDDGGFYSTPIATMTGLADYIVDAGIKVVTVDEGIGMMNP